MSKGKRKSGGNGMKTERKNLTVIFLLAFAIVLVGIEAHDVFASESVTYVSELAEGLQEPIDTAIAPDGNVYVLDRELGKIFAFSQTGTLLFIFGDRGSLPGQLNAPHAICVHPNGNVIVADTGNNRVQVFEPDGQFKNQFAHSGNVEDAFKGPDSVAVDRSGQIYVGDSKSKTIYKFNADGVYFEHRKLTFVPTDLVFDMEDNLYVLLPSISRIIKYDIKTENYDQITIKAKGANPISNAVDISVDVNGNIYLVEAESHSIKKIDQNKTLLLSYGSKGNGKGQFNWPTGVTMDRTGRIYVADAHNKRVQVLADERMSAIAMEPEPALPPLQYFEPQEGSEQRIFVTKVSRPLELVNTPDRITYAISKNMILDEITAEMAFKLGIKKDALSGLIQIEAEEQLEGGLIKLTVSIPDEIPLESNVILSRMKR
jgi:DNA-binding beta-propeller fold protein YncE